MQGCSTEEITHPDDIQRLRQHRDHAWKRLAGVDDVAIVHEGPLNVTTETVLERSRDTDITVIAWEPLTYTINGRAASVLLRHAVPFEQPLPQLLRTMGALHLVYLRAPPDNSTRYLQNVKAWIPDITVGPCVAVIAAFAAVLCVRLLM